MAEQTNYIEDDWGDNALSGRSSASKGVYYSYHTGGTGDLLKGVYRPVWTAPQAGSQVSTSNGVLILDNTGSPDPAVQTPSELTSGACQFDMTVTADATGSVFEGCVLFEDGNNNYNINAVNNGNLRWQKFDAGTATNIITGAWADDTNWHTYKSTRDAYGNHELTYDGTSQGTATDTYLPDTQAVELQNHLNTDIIVHIDNLVIQ